MRELNKIDFTFPVFRTFFNEEVTYSWKAISSNLLGRLCHRKFTIFIPMALYFSVRGFRSTFFIGGEVSCWRISPNSFLIFGAINYNILEPRKFDSQYDEKNTKNEKEKNQRKEKNAIKLKKNTANLIIKKEKILIPR